MLEILVRLAAVVLVVTFAWASVAKVVAWARWRRAVALYRLGGAAFAVSVGVPAGEALTALLLLRGWLAPGAAAAIALLSSFSLAIARARLLEGDRLPCGCFGGAATRDARAMLVRNGSLGVLAAGILVAAPSAAVPRPLPEGIAWPALLAGLGLVLAAWTGWEALASLRGRPDR
jgi:hypothetical protein